MPKILYIEDELTKNIATIKKFFAPILKPKQKLMELNELENSDRVFPEDVVNACRYYSEIDIAYTFPFALERIIRNHHSYDLIVIDRNLSIYDYSEEFELIHDLLSEIGLSDMESRMLEFHEREGDLLLLTLLRINPEYRNKVYYLTANTRDDLRISQDMQTTLDLGSFTKDHILEKGSAAEAVLSDILSNMKAFRIQNDYQKQCNILRSRLTEDDVNNFIKLVGYHHSDVRSEFVFYLRNLLDNLLHHIAYQMGEPDAPYWNDKNKKQLQAKSFIKGFKAGNSFVGLPACDSKYNIGYNSIVRNACLSIFEVSSDCGIHELSKAIDVQSLSTGNLSKHTMHSLLNQICDVIVWYDTALSILGSIR